MTSSTVCALAARGKNAMAANAGSKKRKTLVNSTNGVSRKSAFMNSPNLTVSDNTQTEGTETANLLLLRRNQQHLVSRLLPCCQEVSLYWHLELQMQAQPRHDYRSPVPVPYQSAKHAPPVIERLPEIGAESVFDRRLQRMSRDFRLGRSPRKEIVHRLAVTSHVGVIHKT